MTVTALGGPVDGGRYVMPEGLPVGTVTLGWVHGHHGVGKNCFMFNEPSSLGYSAQYKWDGEKLTYASRYETHSV